MSLAVYTALRCDDCRAAGKITEGPSSMAHTTTDPNGAKEQALQAGWEQVFESGGWRDLCPDCFRKRGKANPAHKYNAPDNFQVPEAPTDDDRAPVELKA